MEWAVEVEDMTVAYTTKPVLWDVDTSTSGLSPNGVE